MTPPPLPFTETFHNVSILEHALLNGCPGVQLVKEVTLPALEAQVLPAILRHLRDVAKHPTHWPQRTRQLAFNYRLAPFGPCWSVSRLQAESKAVDQHAA